MAYTEDPKNNPKDDNTLIEIEIKAKASPELQEWITTTTEAGRVIIKVGKTLVPLLLLASAIAHQVLPQSITNPNQQPTVEATKEIQKQP